MLTKHKYPLLILLVVVSAVFYFIGTPDTVSNDSESDSVLNRISDKRAANSPEMGEKKLSVNPPINNQVVVDSTTDTKIEVGLTAPEQPFSPEDRGIPEGSILSAFLVLPLGGELSELSFQDYVDRLQQLLNEDKALFAELLLEYDSLDGEMRSTLSALLSSLDKKEFESLLVDKYLANSDNKTWSRMLGEFGVRSRSGVELVLENIAAVSNDDLPYFIHSLRPAESASDQQDSITVVLNEYVGNSNKAVVQAVMSVAASSNSSDDSGLVTQSFVSADEEVRHAAINAALTYGTSSNAQIDGLIEVVANESEQAYLRSNAYNAVSNSELSVAQQSILENYKPLFDESFE